MTKSIGGESVVVDRGTNGWWWRRRSREHRHLSGEELCAKGRDPEENVLGWDFELRVTRGWH